MFLLLTPVCIIHYNRHNVFLECIISVKMSSKRHLIYIMSISGVIFMNKNDRRSKKTETALLGALSELLGEKQLRDITVNELVNRADLHRSTFYTHYSDIYDLYERTENAFIKMLNDYATTNSSNEYKELFAGIINYLDSNRWCSLMFFGQNCEPTFQAKIFDLLIDRYLKICAYEEQVTKIPEEWHLLAAYHVGGNISLLKYWVQNGFAYPKDKLMEMLFNIDIGFDKIFSLINKSGN